MLNPTKITWCLVYFISIHLVMGQHWKNLSTDELFRKARAEAFNGNRDESRKMLKYILEKSPDYEDVRILLARTYAWDGDRNAARTELNKVLEVNPKSKDGLNALADVEIWDEKYDAALMVVNNALSYYPTFEDFLYKKSSILYELKQPEESKEVLTTLLNINPAHQKGLDLSKSIELQGKIYTVGATYALDVFSRTFSPAHYGSIQLSRQNAWGSSIVRLNYANRFNSSGLQYEIDLYPRISNGVYAYLNYGYSSSSIFPVHRAGAEIFSKLPKRLELSGGVRYLNFGSVNTVYIYTGSLGVYFKNYWLSVRPYITPDKKTGTSYSTTLSFRKYWQDSENYIGLNIGAGFSPDERRFQSGNGFTGDNIYVLKSQRFGVMLQRSLSPTFLILASAGITRQEVILDTGSYLYMTNVSIGFRKKL